MSATRSTLLGLLVVYALSLALAAASASAATPEWWVEGKLLTETEKLTSEAIKAPENIIIKGPSVGISCDVVKIEGGTITKSEGKANAILFEGCKVSSPSDCEVAKIKTEPLTFPLEKSGSVIKLKFKPQSGSLIAAFTLEGASCALKGKVVEVTAGKEEGMDCNYPGVETESLEHTLEFTKSSGTSFKVNGEPAEFIGNFKWKLELGKLFSAR
jgi:hypothetical protein